MHIVAKHLEIDSPFLNRALGAPFKLSTSQVISFLTSSSLQKSPFQTPQHQMAHSMKLLNNTPELFWPVGAFPCPAGSDYGVCYTVGGGGRQLAFHVATNKDDPHTVGICTLKNV